MQHHAGPPSATDGEFRRASWPMDFIYQIGGVSQAPGNVLSYEQEVAKLELIVKVAQDVWG
jgi:5-methyltetrahydropteroyltriglutamate--homocysteine methyltransferase